MLLVTQYSHSIPVCSLLFSINRRWSAGTYQLSGKTHNISDPSDIYADDVTSLSVMSLNGKYRDRDSKKVMFESLPESRKGGN